MTRYVISVSALYLACAVGSASLGAETPSVPAASKTTALLNDSGGRAFRYRARGESRVDLMSGGPDRRFGTADDTAWTNIDAVVAGASIKRPSP